jgi:hypothetical protein
MIDPHCQIGKTVFRPHTPKAEKTIGSMASRQSQVVGK